MKPILTLTMLVAGAAGLAAAELKPEVTKAIDKLKAQANYSWTAKMEMPGSQFTLPPSKGQLEKNGFTMITQEMNDSTFQAVMKGEKTAMKIEDAWRLTSELEADGGGGRGVWMARMIARMKSPAEEAADLLSKVKDLKAGEAGMCSGELTEAAAKELLTFGRRRPNADNPPPEPKNAKGSVKFWVKEGLLIKYESTLEGTMTIREEERDVKRIRTVEIQDVGKTKVDVPEEARKKLS